MVKWLRITVVGLLPVLWLACNETPVSSGDDEDSMAAIEREMSADSVWIIFFKPGAVSDVRAEAEKIAQRYNGEVRYVYDALEGFSAKLPPVAILALRRDPRVEMVGPDTELVRASHQAQASALWGSAVALSPRSEMNNIHRR